EGSILDTSDDNNVVDFRKNNKEFINTISNIRHQIIQNQELVDFIKNKFAIKNTSGYSLNAFLDFTDPIIIIERLIIGSEDTLGFISNVTLNT
ncbi:FAD-binding oxidoreductase, partial [Francisella tularensis subsp. holarctica]|nr:FAD-binding oxidoreductase [Francisella tularensis subsp. holarctica]